MAEIEDMRPTVHRIENARYSYLQGLAAHYQRQRIEIALQKTG